MIALPYIRLELSSSDSCILTRAHRQGISLPIEQFNTLIKLLPHIETVLAEKGQSVERPDYSGVGVSAAVEEEEEEEEEKGEEGDEEAEKKGKKNFEETSDDE